MSMSRRLLQRLSLGARAFTLTDPVSLPGVGVVFRGVHTGGRRAPAGSPGTGGAESPRVPARADIPLGCAVHIVQKLDQRSGKLTHGVVKRLLTSSTYHPHGIKVELQSGEVGRVKKLG
jgi:uncharacterized repeat protein (TIGR03833 family)